MTKFYRLDGLNNRNLFSHCSWRRPRSQRQNGQFLLRILFLAFAVFPDMAEKERLCSGVPFYTDTNAIGKGKPL